MLINLTNHPSAYWSKAQTDAANEVFGGVIDMPFPPVAADADERQISDLAGQYAARVLSYRAEGRNNVTSGTAALVQGEFTLVYALVTQLEKEGIPCYAACSNRVSEESVDEAGVAHKKTEFHFVRFRRYKIVL